MKIVSETIMDYDCSNAVETIMDYHCSNAVETIEHCIYSNSSLSEDGYFRLST
jgi:hypothetical protein